MADSEAVSERAVRWWQVGSLPLMAMWALNLAVHLRDGHMGWIVLSAFALCVNVRKRTGLGRQVEESL